MLKTGESLHSRSTRWCDPVTGRALAIARGYEHDWGILLDSGAAFLRRIEDDGRRGERRAAEQAILKTYLARSIRYLLVNEHTDTRDSSPYRHPRGRGPA
jgi:hypothetical protein